MISLLLAVAACGGAGSSLCRLQEDGEYFRGKTVIMVEPPAGAAPGDGRWSSELDLLPLFQSLDTMTGGRVVSNGFQYGVGVEGWVILLGDEEPSQDVMVAATKWRIDVYVGARHTVGELLDVLEGLEFTEDVHFTEVDERSNAVRLAFNTCDVPMDDILEVIGDVNVVFEVPEG